MINLKITWQFIIQRDASLKNILFEEIIFTIKKNMLTMFACLDQSPAGLYELIKEFTSGHATIISYCSL